MRVVGYFHSSERGGSPRLILNAASASEGKADPNLVQLVGNAHRWVTALTIGEVSSVDELAGQEGMPANEISRVLQIAFLAPDITKAILLGAQPVDLNAERLKRLGKLPGSWQQQRQRLGLAN